MNDLRSCGRTLSACDVKRAALVMFVKLLSTRAELLTRAPNLILTSSETEQLIIISDNSHSEARKAEHSRSSGCSRLSKRSQSNL